MRQETNKEIDLLLRRLSGRDGEAARDAETQLNDRHLDADELSSYAQNMAPPKARARYIEHLAECSTCRGLATELSLALGATTVAAPVETVSPASGLKKFLSSLLSPMVLRYAVPALGVIVVMAIGFVVMRQRQAPETMIAKVDERATQPAAGYVDPAQTAAGSAGQLREEQRGGAKPQNETEQPREGGPGGTIAADSRSDTGANETKESKPAGTADSSAAVSAPVTVASPSEVQPFTERSASQLPVIQPTPPAAPKADFTMDGDKGEAKKKEIVAKREAAKTAEVQAASEKEQANEPPRDAPRPAKSTETNRVDQNKANPGTGAVTMGGAGARTTTRRRAEEDKDEAETRSVAGRKFRKERGIWTDTAYDSNTRTVNMARSSEQFRALVADEPAIGTIAEQLDGVVIVVWKGRAYRIR